jgi:cytochrome c-type biogenesis protein CcmH
VIVPVAVVLLYQRLGNPGASVVADVAASHEVSEQQILAMVDSLAKRLKQKPDDADGWILLARSYRALERFPESADAYAHANELIKDDANLLADYADVLGMTQGRKLAGKPAELIARALAIDPHQQKALALAGTVALEQGGFARSLEYWRRLNAELAPGSEEARQVAAVIDEIEGAHPEVKGAAPAVRTRPALAPALASTAKAASPGTAASAATISGRVDLAPALAPKVSVSDTVFIYARPAEGSRMPLAVLRIPAKELPRAFTLDDTMAMAPGAVLSKASSVVVEARISKSGNAIPQPGDLFGRSPPLKPGISGLAIVIDSVVP